MTNFILLLFSLSLGEIDKTPVSELDINRYMGRWYEIARFDHFFERGKVGVTADYKLLSDGSIEVINTGYKHSLDGEKTISKGRAKRPKSNKGGDGKLKVSFFLWFYNDYIVMELDEENYSYALIGSKSDKYLWILSRTPKMDTSKLIMLIAKAKDRGYDTSNLIFVEQ